MKEKYQNEIKRLLVKIDDLPDYANRPIDMEALILTAQLLDNAIETAIHARGPENFSAVNSNDLTVFVSILAKNAEKLFKLYEGIVNKLPQAAKDELTTKLNAFKDSMITDLAVNAREIRLLAEDITEKQDEKLKLEQLLQERIAETDLMFQEVKTLEDNVRLYAGTNQRTINSLPRKIAGASDKLALIEKMLGEVDEEIQQLFEEHQRGANVMQKIAN